LTFCCSIITSDVMLYCNVLSLCCDLVGAHALPCLSIQSRRKRAPPYVSNLRTVSHRRVVRAAVSEMVLNQRTATRRNTTNREKARGSGETRYLSEPTPRSLLVTTVVMLCGNKSWRNSVKSPSFGVVPRVCWNNRGNVV
jgi:hypothetical protein